MRGQKKQQKLEFLHLNLNLNLNSNNWENEDHIRDHPSVSFFLLLLWMGKWDFLGMGFGDGLKDNLSLLFLLCFYLLCFCLPSSLGSLGSLGSFDAEERNGQLGGSCFLFLFISLGFARHGFQ